MFKKIIIAILLIIFVYCSFGLFVVQPIGAVPDGVTVLYWRLGTNLPFISSADGLLDKDGGGVCLLGRGIMLGGIINKLSSSHRIIVRLPYSSTLYLISTGGVTYSSSIDPSSL